MGKSIIPLLVLIPILLVGLAYVLPGLLNERVQVTQFFCPECPGPSEWGLCANFTQSRTSYACDSSTGFKCVPEGEERTCIPPEEAGKYVSGEYTWTFEGEQFTWRPVFSKALYDYYTNKPRPPTGDYSVYATDPLDDRLITELATVLRDSALRNNFDAAETINFVAAFVQSLPYTADDVTTPFDEYPRYPAETLVDNGGDCEDTSILMSTILSEMGYATVLISPPGHMAVGVGCDSCQGSYYEYEGGKYYYVETTGDNWQVGQVPTEYERSKGRVFQLIPQPIITFDWSEKVVGTGLFDATYQVDITVKNEGSGPAEELKVWVGFDTTDTEKVYAQVEGEPATLDPAAELKTTAKLTVPKGIYTRVHIIVSGGNLYPQEDVGEWFRT